MFTQLPSPNFHECQSDVNCPPLGLFAASRGMLAGMNGLCTPVDNPWLPQHLDTGLATPTSLAPSPTCFLLELPGIPFQKKDLYSNLHL